MLACLACKAHASHACMRTRGVCARTQDQAHGVGRASPSTKRSRHDPSQPGAGAAFFAPRDAFRDDAPATPGRRVRVPWRLCPVRSVFFFLPSPLCLFSLALAVPCGAFPPFSSAPPHRVDATIQQATLARNAKHIKDARRNGRLQSCKGKSQRHRPHLIVCKPTARIRPHQPHHQMRPVGVQKSERSQRGDKAGRRNERRSK